MSPSLSHKPRKTADRTITILVLGDDQVGKSSLISTFVSRHFVEHDLPGLMTRVQLPPNELYGKTVIVDSQQGDQALLQALEEQPQQSTVSSTSSSSLVPPSALPRVDSILLVYDLSRPETFARMEEHWLQLLERAYQGKVPVIVAENKYDLFAQEHAVASGPGGGGSVMSSRSPSDEALQRKRQQIVSLMQRFPFVRQCIKCSAKDFLHVDDIFLKAQQAVLYPFSVLYDLEKARLSLHCQRALQRMFRIYDQDQDGLLNDVEMERFQRQVVYFMDSGDSLQVLKKIVKGHIAADELRNVAVLSPDGHAFTVAGFLVLFDVLINQNRLDRVWEALRKFGYNDELELDMHELQSDSSHKLTDSERRFLVRLFQQYASSTSKEKTEGEKELTMADIHQVFSVIDPPLPPWSLLRAPQLFDDGGALPKQYAETSRIFSSPDSSGLSEDLAQKSSPKSVSTPDPTPAQQPSTPQQQQQQQQNPLSSSGISILSASDSLPSLGSLAASLPTAPVNLSQPEKQSMNMVEWMGHWHMMVATNAVVARQELYRLGYMSSSSLRSRPSKRSGGKKSSSPSHTSLPYRSREVRVLVLGCKKKADLIQSICVSGGGDSDAAAATTTIVEPEATSTHSSSSSSLKIETTQTHVKIRRTHTRRSGRPAQDLVSHFVFFSPTEASVLESNNFAIDSFDLVLLVFDDIPSLDHCQLLERLHLAPSMPRVFVALSSPNTDDDEQNKSILQAATKHATARELEGQPLLWALQVAKDKPESAKNEETRPANEAIDSFLTTLARCCIRDAGLDGLLQSSPYEAQRRRREQLFHIGLGVVGVVVVIGVGFSLASSWFQSWFSTSTSSPPSGSSSSRRK